MLFYILKSYCENKHFRMLNWLVWYLFSVKDELFLHCLKIHT